MSAKGTSFAALGAVHVKVNRAKGGPNGGLGKVPSDIRQHQESLGP